MGDKAGGGSAAVAFCVDYSNMWHMIHGMWQRDSVSPVGRILTIYIWLGGWRWISDEWHTQTERQTDEHYYL